MTSDITKLSIQRKCRSDVSTSIKRPEMLSSLQDESSLVVVMVNVVCLQTDGAFKDEGWV